MHFRKRLKKVDTNAVTIPEAFPENLIDLFNQETNCFELLENSLTTAERDQRLRNITLNEPEPMGYGSIMAPMDYDFLMDALGPLVEFEEPSVFPQPPQNIYENQLFLSPPRGESSKLPDKSTKVNH